MRSDVAWMQSWRQTNGTLEGAMGAASPGCDRGGGRVGGEEEVPGREWRITDCCCACGVRLPFPPSWRCSKVVCTACSVQQHGESVLSQVTEETNTSSRLSERSPAFPTLNNPYISSFTRSSVSPTLKENILEPPTVGLYGKRNGQQEAGVGRNNVQRSNLAAFISLFHPGWPFLLSEALFLSILLSHSPAHSQTKTTTRKKEWINDMPIDGRINVTAVKNSSWRAEEGQAKKQTWIASQSKCRQSW